MASGCGDILSLEDLKTAKLHQIFEAEVITGKRGGVATGEDIDYATNPITGQIQKTLPAVLRDAGFRPAPFTFISGGTLAVGDSDVAVLWPVSDGGDGAYYIWKGAYPKTIPAGSSPQSSGGVSSSAWSPVGDITLRKDIADTSAVNKGDSLIGVKQPFTGAIARTQHGKNTDFVSVKDFGAKGDLSNDDTLAVNAAVAALAPGGGVLYFPKGLYKITDAITVSNMPIHICGDGMMSTAIVQYGAGKSGVKFDSNTAGNAPATDNLLINTLQFSDISVNKASSGAGIAVDASWKIMTSNTPQFIAERFRTYSMSNANFCWEGAVRLVNCNGVRISKCQLHGNPLESAVKVADPYTMKYGLQFVNRDDSLGLVSFFIDSLTVMCASRGIQVYGWHEGFEMVNCELVQVNTGIEVFGNATKQNPDLFYLNSHIEARQNAVSLSNVFKPKFIGCDLFKFSDNTVDGVLVSLSQCNFASITGTTFSTNDTTTSCQGLSTDANSYHGNVSGSSFIGMKTNGSRGINLLSANWIIDGNNFYQCTTGIGLFGATNRIGINQFTDCTLWVSDAGLSNVKQPREYITDYQFVVSSAGPDQAFNVTVPSGFFKSVPELCSAIPVTAAGPGMFVFYDRANSNASSVRFIVKATASIPTGTYPLAISMKGVQ